MTQRKGQRHDARSVRLSAELMRGRWFSSCELLFCFIPRTYPHIVLKELSGIGVSALIEILVKAHIVGVAEKAIALLQGRTFVFC